MSDYFTSLIEKEDERKRICRDYYDLLIKGGNDKRDGEIVRLKSQVRYWKRKAGATK